MTRTLSLTCLLAFFLYGQEKPPAMCTVSGTVTDAVTGQPLNKVELRAEKTGGGDDTIAGASTDSKGAFTLIDLKPGEYRLKGRRSGYLEMYYGARRADSKGAAIALETGQDMRDLAFQLMPFGVIAGTVRDPDGDTVPGAKVSLFRVTYTQTGRSTVSDSDGITDDLGQYRIADLRPGRYYVLAEPKQEEHADLIVDHSAKSAGPPTVLLPTMYPGVTDPGSGRTIEVSPGSRAVGIDIGLQRGRVFKVTAHVTAAPGLEVNRVWLENAHALRDWSREIYGRAINRDGDFEILQAPPGSYTLVARGGPPSKHNSDISIMDFFQRRYEGRVPVEVGSSDVMGVHVTINSGTEVTGHVTVEAGEKPDLSGSYLQFDRGNSEDLIVRVTGDNSFATGLYSGHYYIDWWLSRDSNLIVKSIRWAEVDVMTDGIAIPEAGITGGKISLEIVVAREGGQAEGVVLDKDDKPAGGATVVLVPEARLRSHYRYFRDSATDQYGRFRFTNLQPGSYKLFAWDDVESDAWLDPDYLKDFEDRGAAVVVSPNGRVTAQLHVLTAR